MARLVKKYGNKMCQDVTRCALPLFFLVVKTSVDYQVVAAFLIEEETTENIIAALAITKG